MTGDPSGCWIALEGGDAAGKSTQAARLAQRLHGVLTREPGGTALGDRIRSLLLDRAATEMHPRTEALLMAADRAQHVAERVRPILDAGGVVVSDRSAYSSLAYQGYGRDLGVEAVRSLCDWATEGLWPDLVVLLDVPPPVAGSRMGTERDRLEAEGDDFHGRVAAGFTALASAEPGRWRVVSGVGSIEEVGCRVLASYEEWLEHRG